MQLFLGSMVMFFASHGIVKISYNILARRTARNPRFRLLMLVFSTVIGAWSLANIIVVAIALAKMRSPRRIFFYVSGALSIAIVLGQLLAFLWLIWQTKAPLKVKARWSLSMGAFVPYVPASCRS